MQIGRKDLDIGVLFEVRSLEGPFSACVESKNGVFVGQELEPQLLDIKDNVGDIFNNTFDC